MMTHLQTRNLIEKQLKVNTNWCLYALVYYHKFNSPALSWLGISQLIYSMTDIFVCAKTLISWFIKDDSMFKNQEEFNDYFT